MRGTLIAIVLAGLIAGCTQSHLQIRDRNKGCLSYEDAAPRPTSWAVTAQAVAVVAQPISAVPKLYEPYPPTQRFMTVAVYGMLGPSTPQAAGQLVLVRGNDRVFFLIDSITQSSAGLTVDASAADQTVRLTVRGSPSKNWQRVAQEAVALVGGEQGNP